MPAKRDSEKPTVNSSKPEKGALSKREVTMPDGRYMIFYTDRSSDKKQEQKP
jgi:hypothetical protein